MTKVTIEPNCGNAPKQLYVKDFEVAFASSDVDKLIDMFADDASWTIVGQAEYIGKQNIKDALLELTQTTATEIVFDSILSHGKLCSASGKLIYQSTEVAFSDVIEFASHSKDAPIKKLTSYCIEL